jgi:hypothetical protein
MSVESGLAELLQQLEVRTPSLRPAIFPTILEHLCGDDETLVRRAKDWSSKQQRQGDETEIVFITEVDVEQREVQIVGIKVSTTAAWATLNRTKQWFEGLRMNQARAVCSTPSAIWYMLSWRTVCVFGPFVAKFVNQLDATLYSLEGMMKLLVIGEEDEVAMASARFLEANGYGTDIITHRTVVNEAYNVAYSIKVLVRYEFRRTCWTFFAGYS